MNDPHVVAAPAAAPQGSTLPIRFTASGSEYFRIWIVNLLLTLVTFGLYYPWAKVRRLRYFYGNTWVGDHAFDFHGDPKRMLRGTLLVGALFGVYSFAGQVSAAAGLVALLLVAAVWPALVRTSLRFRLANTSWRGMRFHFNGTVAGAYQAVLPILLPGLVLVGLTLFMPEGDDEAAAQAWTAAKWVGIALVVAMLAALALLPLMLWSLKRYQHGHYALGHVQSELRTGPGAFYGLFAKASGVSLLCTLALGAVAGLVAVVSGIGFSGGLAPGKAMTAVLLGGLLLGAGYIVVLAVGNTFLASRLQNLLWNRTKSTEVRFESDLRLAPLVVLTLKNWVLVALTLGLYWPFAAVATARMKLQAVTVYTRRPVDALTARAGLAGAADATGDAAGDVFGLDLGL